MTRRNDNEDVRLSHAREALRTGLWFVPTLFVVGSVLLAVGTVAVDHSLGGRSHWFSFNGGPTSAQQVLTTVATSMMTFTGLVFTITVVALQLASSQFSPRVMRTFLRDRGSQVALGVFTATFVFALIVLGQIRTGTVGDVFVPGLSINVAFALVIVSLVTFVYFVNHITQSLRVVNIIESVAIETRQVLDATRPVATGEMSAVAAIDPGDLDAIDPGDLVAITQVVNMRDRGAVVIGVDVDGMVELARRHDCVLELVPDMGAFVAGSAPIVAVHGGRGDIHDAQVRRQIDVGRERTMRQDPAYGFRQLADIAEKALSPALNDPTTAIQAIDRLHDLLRRAASSRTPSGVHRDQNGTVRFVRSTVDWNELVTLAYEEVREYGSRSMQVHRRLRASIEELLAVVDETRRAPLLRQLALLDRSAARSFPDAEERRLASEADESGLGNAAPPG